MNKAVNMPYFNSDRTMEYAFDEEYGDEGLYKEFSFDGFELFEPNTSSVDI